MNYVNELKKRLKENAILFADKYKLSGVEYESAFIFDSVEMSFEKESYEAIRGKKDWYIRTQKKHTHFTDGTLEMQSCNSSDALLMNIFCNPNFKSWNSPQNLLNISIDHELEFGWNPDFENEHPQYPTEIDLKIGNHIFEAKLTEKSFTTKSKSVVDLYSDFKDVFEESYLLTPKKEIQQYQLIRNILTANKYNFFFTVIIDSSRIDLMKEVINVLKSIKDSDLRSRINIVTWQEIIDSCESKLKIFLQEKYANQLHPTND